jgi:NADH-quinone oxidoreductase subunit L
VLFIGATTALFMGFLGIINNDIKRVVAYSTLSQLGYMTVALGASVYNIAIFHLMTHAFFKALLFLAAGSVIIGMHHEQDMRKMGGLFGKMKITAITCWIGTLALIGTPLFSGFYSKDLIIDAVKEQHHLHPDNAIVTYALWCVMIGVFVTAFYSFRLLFMTFHGKPRWAAADAHGHGHDDHAAHDAHAETHPVVHAGHVHETHDEPGDHHHGGEPHESPWVVTLPLILLAIPSVLIGLLTVVPLIFGDGFGSSIVISEAHNVIPELREEFHGVWAFAGHALATPVFWLVAFGVVAAWALYIKWPDLPNKIDSKLKPLRVVLENKYWFDWINENIIAAGSRLLGKFFWKAGDGMLIDGLAIDGSTKVIGWFASVIRRVQSGFLYSYAFWMVIGLAVMIGWFLSRLH